MWIFFICQQQLLSPLSLYFWIGILFWRVFFQLVIKYLQVQTCNNFTHYFFICLYYSNNVLSFTYLPFLWQTLIKACFQHIHFSLIRNNEKLKGRNVFYCEFYAAENKALYFHVSSICNIYKKNWSLFNLYIY